MKRFVYACAEDFAAYEKVLRDGRCHVFDSCALPDCCSAPSARIGFEKNGRYMLYIDKGLHSTSGNSAFESWLTEGEAGFDSMVEMAEFFYALRPLFEKEKPIVDKEELRSLKASKAQPRMVWPEEISRRLKAHIFGQDEALDAIADKIVISRMQKQARLLTIGLIGPTATGKSETAKSLAAIISELYGEDCGFIEIAGSEFLSPHSVHRFFGAPPGYVGHGEPTLLEPVRKTPCHVVVINEIEKADDKLLVGLMEAIDTGKLGMADNSAPIDLSRCILLFTSNLPINMEEYMSLPPHSRSEFCRDAFTRHCSRPEISGKIGSFIVFQPLSPDAVTDILIKFLELALADYELNLKRVEPELMLDFLHSETRYGARGIRELVSDSVGRQLLRNREFEKLKGKNVALGGSIEDIHFSVI